jgi:dihydroxyacetone kinase-like protein
VASAESLVAVFQAITQNLEQDRDNLNRLDRDDGDSGDNMVANFQLVTDTLAQVLSQRQQGQGDVGAALSQAAQALRANGRGATAPIYAEGLDDAASRLQGRDQFSMDDLMPLLEGLLGGAQRAGGERGAAEGDGTLLDALIPGVMGYLQGKREGMGELEAVLNGLMTSRRGSTRTVQSSRGYGRSTQRDTSGEVDPGAAGASSMLEGLFGAILQTALQSQAGKAPPAVPAPAAPATPDRPNPTAALLELAGEFLKSR